MKTYFSPTGLRRGEPVLTFVKKKGSKYFLGTYYDRKFCKKMPYRGVGKEYESVINLSIGKELYDAFVKEAKARHKRVRDAETFKKKYLELCKRYGCFKRKRKACAVCSCKSDVIKKTAKKLGIKVKDLTPRMKKQIANTIAGVKIGEK